MEPGDEITVGLVVQNRSIGHSLVPEQRDFYESWMEFQVKDGQGTELFHSGGLDGPPGERADLAPGLEHAPQDL